MARVDLPTKEVLFFYVMSSTKLHTCQTKLNQTSTTKLTWNIHSENKAMKHGVTANSNGSTEMCVWYKLQWRTSVQSAGRCLLIALQQHAAVEYIMQTQNKLCPLSLNSQNVPSIVASMQKQSHSHSGLIWKVSECWLFMGICHGWGHIHLLMYLRTLLFALPRK